MSLIIALAIISGQLIRIPISTGGVTLLDISVILFCLAGLIKIKFRLKKPPQFILTACIFILIAFISLIFTPLHLKFGEYLTGFFYIIRFASYILFGWLIYSKAFENFKNQITDVLAYSGIGLSILGLLQFIFLPNLQFLSTAGWDPHYYRTVSAFLDPNFAGAFFVLTFILLLSLRESLSQVSKGRQSILFFLLIYLALLTTFSRSSYLMFLISGLVFSILKKSKITFLSILILFTGLLLGFQIYTQLVSTPRHIDRGQSASFRLSAWQQGLTLFEKFPIFGVGYNAYRYGLEEFNLADKQFINSHGASSNDSSLLFVAATTGILGLLSYLLFLGSLIWKTKNYILIAALSGLVIHSIFANSLFFSPILLWIILISLNPKK